MRVIVFFDLPTTTAAERREYNRFRKKLIKEGFLMMQESVYVKLALNYTVVTDIVNTVKSNKPSSGLVQILSVTEKQFAKMEYVIGTSNSDVISSDERIVII